MAPVDANPLSEQQLQYLINHIFLPPQLPQADDSDNQGLLLHATGRALAEFSGLLPVSSRSVVDQALSSFRLARSIYGPSGSISSEPALLNALSNLATPLPVYVQAQNAGLIFSKTTANRVVVEEFELAPLNRAVNGSKGRLIRTFPALALSIPESVFNQSDFLKMIAQTLFTLSYQPAPGMQPQSSKSGKEQDEPRDTTHPGMISEFFMNLVKPAGNAVNLPSISKNTRDEVLWSHAALPWRRSPLWLLIRVTLQLFFSRSTLPGLYKEFMVFLMSSVLRSRNCQKLPSDVLFTMNAKIARRLLKLRRTNKSTIHETVLVNIYGALSQSDALLCKRWKNIQQQDSKSLDFESLKTLHFQDDTLVSTPALDEYFLLLKRRQSNLELREFNPTPRMVIYKPEELPQLSISNSADHSYTVATLQAFETWISCNLDTWTTTHLNEGACLEVTRILKVYHSFAAKRYNNNPEALSIMLLTLFELWMSLDKIATTICPLLSAYDPGVPTQVLENLLLTFKCQIVRLDAVEKYLITRRKGGGDNALLFDAQSNQSFAARYFDQSPKHQELSSTINVIAVKDKARKLAEFRRLKVEYARLVAVIDSSTCKTEQIYNEYTEVTTTQCVRDCQRCRDMNSLGRLTISSHEWPLPKNPTRAKVVVFELQVPHWHASWRDTTSYLLQNVLQASYIRQAPRESFQLQYDCHLGLQYFQASSVPRQITLLSENKPHAVTHWNGKNVGLAREADVCVENGLDYRYFDLSKSTFVSILTFNSNVAAACTYRTTASALQKFLFRPAASPDGLPPNKVIASQHECPADMGLQEFKELCSLPLGHRIQWENILLQLVVPAIDFKKTTTTMFILQCLHQAGPRGNSVTRPAHQRVLEDSFAKKILESLDVALDRIKENWECSQAVRTFSAIAATVLTLTPSTELHNTCLAFLHCVRSIVFHWMSLLREKAHEEPDPERHTLFVAKSMELALICASTFDVDRAHLEAILVPTKAASTLLQCSIVIQEGQRSHPPESDDLLSLRITRVLHRCQDLLVKHRLALDDAVRTSWSGYAPGTTWHVVSSQCFEWVTCVTAGKGLPVHYNVLTGELLVNGLPLDRPPKHYEEQQLFRSLFGHYAVEVMPTAVVGMQFSTKKTFEGWSAQLGMTGASSNPPELIVQASDGQSTWETIPTRLLQDHYPPHFIANFVHWHNLQDGTVQFRPKQQPWNATSPGIWTMFKNKTGLRWQLTQDKKFLVGSQSKTSFVVTSICKSLSQPNRIHILSNAAHDSIDIDISRLKIAFVVAKGSGRVYSKQYRGFHIDDDQSLGTLQGLQTKLLLKDDKTGHRQLLLPEAQVSHVRLSRSAVPSVSVALDSEPKLHVLDVDNKLGRLVDNGSLHGKMFLAYLHALTSFCLPDPLTGKTGTEQALSILSSAAVRSFAQLSPSDVDVLMQISRITPTRSFYPAHMQGMQTVHWDPYLTSLSQHGDFARVVSTLLQQASTTKILYPESKIQLPQVDVGSPFLHERDLIRSSTFRTDGFGAERHTTTYDMQYKSRDQDQVSQRAKDVYSLSKLIYSGSASRYLTASTGGYIWKSMSTLARVQPITETLKSTALKYDSTYTVKDEAGSDSTSFILRYWPSLHKLLTDRCKAPAYKYSFMAWLSSMAWGSTTDLAVLQSLALMLNTDTVSGVTYPASLSTLSPTAGREAKMSLLGTTIKKHALAFTASPEYYLTKGPRESRYIFDIRKQSTYSENVKSTVEAFARALHSQWPTNNPDTPKILHPLDVGKYIDINGAMGAIRPIFTVCYNNKSFSDYLTRIETAISQLPFMTISSSVLPVYTATRPTSQRGYVSVEDLFLVAAPAPAAGEPAQMTLIQKKAVADTQNDHESPRLVILIKALKAAAMGSQYEAKYVLELQESLSSLQACQTTTSEASPYSAQVLSSHSRACDLHVQEMYSAILSAVSRSPRPTVAFTSTIYLGPHSVQQWPRVSPTFFLQQLARRNFAKLPADWKACLIQYGLALTALQKSERLVKASSLPTTTTELVNELRNVGHENWNPLDFSDSLLMEIESGMLIRKVQEEIAAEMRQPPGDRNAVMQLNMGEGKSSVIVPIVAAALADCSKLVRVVVAKPQSKQMAQMLISKLGGMLDRRVYYLPFSRSIKLTKVEDAMFIGTMVRECMSEGGILLVQPEHMLSFKLMGLESIITGKAIVGPSLLATQEFFEQSSRDIVDESDENFSVKFELIYTMGTQNLMDMGSDRWVRIQQVLTLVEKYTLEILSEFPKSLSCKKGMQGQFPRIRILRQDAEQALVKHVAHHICTYGLEGFPVVGRSSAAREAVFTYITKFDLDQAEIDRVENSALFTESKRPTLLLLRGLLAGSILSFTLAQKRWRVNYGLATRDPPTPLAVPYRAKDNPSPRSEFSHPDVVIVLTCLAYYYGGLRDEDLEAAFYHLSEADGRVAEYAAWVTGSDDLPSAFHSLDGINLEDKAQCYMQVFPHLRQSKSVVDYFLTHIVFPTKMKEFPKKLSSSGWDIAKVKGHPTTGFSGTKDSRALLPLDVEHLDLPDQRHTNALVLEYLLQPTNSVSLMPTVLNSTSSDAEQLLTFILALEKEVQVILDVGAQIIELDNLQVATTWLRMHQDEGKEGVVFCNENDELCVIDRQSRVELLQTSSFNSRLDVCLIYLDEAHTRGIDLKLPQYFRAAVTLGDNLVKDKLVQACMRLRKLGQGQTVEFCVSEEIQTKIRERMKMSSAAKIEVTDVLQWSINETFVDTRRSMPLWAVQGQRFVYQQSLYQEASASGSGAMTKEHAEKFLEEEAQTIERRYRPCIGEGEALMSSLSASTNEDVARIADRCREFENLNFNSNTLQEEQERELDTEKEQERQTEHPPAAQPLTHHLHPDVLTFWSTGTLRRASKAYMPAFEALRDTSGAARFDVAELGDNTVFATQDFIGTVSKSGVGFVSDQYQRHVQWLLSSRTKADAAIEKVLIISPFEANELGHRADRGSLITMHLYKPNSNLSYRFLDRLDFHTVPYRNTALEVPRALAVELNLFAGQLYIATYEDYLEVCNYLGLTAQVLTMEMTAAGWEVADDGFILSDDQGRVGGDSKLKHSPVGFMKLLLTRIRRNGEGIDKTDMGSLLGGEVLQSSDWEESSS